MIRVFVADDHPVVLQGMAILLGESEDLHLVGSASTSVETVRQVGEARPDVVLLDVRLDDTATATLVQRLVEVAPSSAILLFTADVRHFAVPAAILAGAVGAVSKDVAPEVLRRTIRQAAAGERIDSAASRTTEHGVIPSLTPRELEVLRHVALGETNAEIADRLGLSPTTVKTYWQATMQKLGARNRTEAVGRAHGSGLLELPR